MAQSKSTQLLYTKQNKLIQGAESKRKKKKDALLLFRSFGHGKPAHRLHLQPKRGSAQPDPTFWLQSCLQGTQSGRRVMHPSGN